MNTCRELQTRWFDEEATPPALALHVSDCAECRAWVARHERLAQALRGLPRRALPRELDEGVAGELEQPSIERLVEALESLPLKTAPPELDRLVAEELEGEREALPREAGRLRALDWPSVPTVLERLVDEELASPERHVVERFVGDLERLEAPAELLERLERDRVRSHWARTLIAPLTAVAAASLLFWVALRGNGSNERPFRVVRVDDTRSLNPLARGLGESLFGGMPRNQRGGTEPPDADDSDGSPESRGEGG